MALSHNPARQCKPEPDYQHKAASRASSVPGFMHTPTGLFTTRHELVIAARTKRGNSPVLVSSPIWVRDCDTTNAISVFAPQIRSVHVWINRFDPLAIILGRLHSIGIVVAQDAAAAILFYLRNATDENTGWTRVLTKHHRSGVKDLRSDAA